MSASAPDRPLVVGIGGSARAGSSSERVLRACLAEAERLGAATLAFGGPDLALPLYAPERPERDPRAEALVEALRRADGIVLASPGYHGGVSGLIKNALDYAEDLRDDPRPYFDGRAVACIACAFGWQGTVTTLAALRSIVHALRGWPTPLGVAVNSALPLWDPDGALADEDVRAQLRIAAAQVVGFAAVRTVAR